MAQICETCTCPKVECPRHGNCFECVAFHRDINKVKIPHCLRFIVEVKEE